MITSLTGGNLAQVATLLATHLTTHALPELASLMVTSGIGRLELTAQLNSPTTPALASALLAWTETLSAVTAQAWRPLHGDRVQICLHSSLPSPTGALDLCVYGAVTHTPAQFPDLAPGQQQQVSLEQLRTWATTTSTAREGHQTQR
jgi:hypothetical protein